MAAGVVRGGGGERGGGAGGGSQYPTLQLSVVVRHQAPPGVSVRCLVCGGASRAITPAKFRVHGHGRPSLPETSAFRGESFELRGSEDDLRTVQSEGGPKRRVGPGEA